MFPTGIDVVLRVPSWGCVTDIILRACRRHWQGSDCVFEDANDTKTYPFSDPWVWTRGSSSLEFFVYRDRQAAASWEQYGAIKANKNLMFHFIIGDPVKDSPQWREIAVVFDSFTPWVKKFLHELRLDFLSFAATLPEAA